MNVKAHISVYFIYQRSYFSDNYDIRYTWLPWLLFTDYEDQTYKHTDCSIG